MSVNYNMDEKGGPQDPLDFKKVLASVRAYMCIVQQTT